MLCKCSKSVQSFTHVLTSHPSYGGKEKRGKETMKPIPLRADFLKEHPSLEDLVDLRRERAKWCDVPKTQIAKKINE